MSFKRLYHENFSPAPTVLADSQTKLVRSQKREDGVLVDGYEFKECKLSDDERNNISYKELCLGNLQALGVADKLKPNMLQRNDVDLVIDSLEKPVQNDKSAQVSA